MMITIATMHLLMRNHVQQMMPHTVTTVAGITVVAEVPMKK